MISVRPIGINWSPSSRCTVTNVVGNIRLCGFLGFGCIGSPKHSSKAVSVKIQSFSQLLIIIIIIIA